jgi:hydroxyquinol 1,2-dioxygenase
VTHIFDPDDPYIASDAVFGVKESLQAKFDLITDPTEIAKAGFDKPFFLVEHDFILAPT